MFKESAAKCVIILSEIIQVKENYKGSSRFYHLYTSGSVILMWIRKRARHLTGGLMALENLTQQTLIIAPHRRWGVMGNWRLHWNQSQKSPLHIRHPSWGQTNSSSFWKSKHVAEECHYAPSSDDFHGGSTCLMASEEKLQRWDWAFVNAAY